MTDSQLVLRSPFDIETHKETFINYLEVVILEDGTVEYAVPSHQEKLVRVACEQQGLTRKELEDACPPEYYANYMVWLCMQSGAISVWNDFTIGTPNPAQTSALHTLKKAGLYHGIIQY